MIATSSNRSNGVVLLVVVRLALITVSACGHITPGVRDNIAAANRCGTTLPSYIRTLAELVGDAMNRSWFRPALEERPLPILPRFIVGAIADHVVAVDIALVVAVDDTRVTLTQIRES